jgi:hypothetical protein
MAMPSIDQSPPLPDSVKSQMGSASPFSGVSEMLANKPAPSEPDPQGALKAQIDAVKKVLEQVISAAGAGKQFFSRASQLLDQGLAAEAQKGPGTPTNPQPENQSPEGTQAGGMTVPPTVMPG